jgi:hypothetical protein
VVPVFDLRDDLVEDVAKEVAIFSAHNAAPVVFCDRGSECYRELTPNVIGSSEEFVGESGESVAPSPPANRRGLRPCDPLKTKTKILLRRKNKKRSALSRWSEIEHDTLLAGSRWLPDGHRSAANRHRKMAIGTRSGADLGIPGRFRRDPKCGF